MRPTLLPLTSDFCSCVPSRPARGRRYLAALALVTAVAASGAVHAGDVSEIGFAGFTSDGKTFILEEFGMAAGTGQPFAHLFFVDADTSVDLVPAIRARGKQNAFEGRSFFELQQGTLTLRAKNWSYAERQLAGKTEIGTAQNTPPLMSWSGPRLVSETTGERRQELGFGPKQKNKDGDGAGRRFEIRFSTKNLSPNQGEAAGCAPYAMSVVIVDHKTKKQTNLLKESRPASFRGCTTRAEVYGIWASKGRVAVVLAYDAPGFEGPDTRHFVVTGRIP